MTRRLALPLSRIRRRIETWANTNVGEATLRGASLQWNTKAE